MTPSEMYEPTSEAVPAPRPRSGPDRRGAAPATEVALTVNGRRRAVAAGATVADLLRDLDLDPRTIVVEHNHEIVHDRGALGVRALRAGDVVELVHFVGGG